MRHTGDSDRLSVVYLVTETQGLAFQRDPFSGCLVLRLIVLFACQIKQPILLIGDLILYITFPNFWLLLGFLIPDMECFF